VQGARHSRCFQHCATPSLKQIPAFDHHVVISFSALSKYMTSKELRSSSQSNHQGLRQAFLMCQTETAQRLNVPPSKICWYLEWPYEACAHKRLCTSFSAWSGGCKLSAMVARIALSVECIFLVLEHEHLSSIADPFFKPPKHPILDAIGSPLPPRPELPEAALLATASVRCGVNDLVQMEVALRRILVHLVQQFRGWLPQGKWLAVCKQIIRIAQFAVETLRSTPSHQPQASSMHITDSMSDKVAECCFEV
jgi:hypothetical protein